MNKKSVILFFSALVLLTLGVFYVIADLTGLTIPYAGDGVSVSNYISTIPNQMNLTLVASAGVGSIDNITNVTFTFDNANVTWYPVAPNGDLETLLAVDAGLKNITYDVNGEPWTQWNCTNSSADTINCLLGNSLFLRIDFSIL